MANPNSHTYYTSSRRPEGQQLPPLRNHLPEFFDGPAVGVAHTSRNVAHDNSTNARRYAPSHASSPSPSTNDTNTRRPAQPNASHPPRSRREEAALPYALYNRDMEQRKTSENPNFPSRPVRASNGDTTRRYPCELCDERFDRPSGLETHMRSHTQEKPYPCSQRGCNKSFSVKSNLRRHEKTHTSSSAFEDVDDEHPYNQSYSSHHGEGPSSSKPSSSSYYSSSSRFK